MARVLVTGGAGFLGSHLIDRLIARGDEVICVDNFFTGQRQNIAHLADHPRFTLLEHDIIEPLRVDVEQIYNLACPASPVHYQYNPIRTIKTSTVGMVNMLGLAKRTGARILQASTSEVYGDPTVHPQPETYWGNVNPIGVRSCFSEDTEVLTEDGWKLFKEVTLEDKVATLNQEGFLEYQQPTDILKEPYVGELIAFKSSKIDLLVTPNHNMYVRRREEPKFELRPAYDAINWSRSEMEKSAHWEGIERPFFYLPPITNSKFGNVEKIDMDLWLEFLGYYLSEGCVYLRKRIRIVNGKEYAAVDYNVLIAQDRKNIPEREKITACLQKLPFTFHSSDDHQFRITNKQLALYLIAFGKSHEKYIPKELKQLSKRQLRILFSALMLGDGSKTGKSFYTNSTTMAGDFQELLLKLGFAGSTHVKDTRKPRAVYKIHILDDLGKDFLTPFYPRRTIEKYSGHVYCVTVPNRVIYVRRSGKALFCGNCYDEGKRVAETLCMDYHRQTGVDVRIVRIFNTYGPRMHPQDGRVVSNFIVQALQGTPLTVYGEGAQTRSFCYVDDLLEAMIRTMDQTTTLGPINIGNPAEISVRELAETIIRLTGSSSPIEQKPLPADDPRQRQPDITLARSALQWEPVTTLEAGLARTIAYFREHA